MAHKSKPRDTCGGSVKCGGNLLVSESDVDARHLKALRDTVETFLVVRRAKVESRPGR
jgi:hypothetical protein